MNVRPEIIKLLEKTGSEILDIGFTDDFLGVTSKARQQKQKQVRQHQTKKYLHSKGSHMQNDKKTTKWKKLFANYINIW